MRKRKGRSKSCVDAVERMIKFYQPQVIVLEEHKGKKTQRHGQAIRLLKALESLASKHRLELKKYPISKVRSTFEIFGSSTKFERAKFIQDSFSTVNLPLPESRKIWLPEKFGMAVYDAITLVITYYYLET